MTEARRTEAIEELVEAIQNNEVRIPVTALETTIGAEGRTLNPDEIEWVTTETEEVHPTPTAETNTFRDEGARVAELLRPVPIHPIVDAIYNDQEFMDTMRPSAENTMDLGTPHHPERATERAEMIFTDDETAADPAEPTPIRPQLRPIYVTLGQVRNPRLDVEGELHLENVNYSDTFQLGEDDSFNLYSGTDSTIPFLRITLDAHDRITVYTLSDERRLNMRMNNANSAMRE